ncbi:copper resistance protein B [Novosphingobium sp. KACC 22771]|uniref:copper resistance protein B n=1 Tax=Novosphingobium sp. KACC 22771 TaxID=3025670 RepID=UPI0023671756|nr:copper resistance protein B [Novosphingobium sp. KACC 22771]WDF73657.1 copper resistance protein B [Novosphingobium sp. KACC 22771]
MRMRIALAFVLALSATSLHAQETGTDQSPGSAPAPAPAHDRLADRYFDPAAMARAEAAMMNEHGNRTYSQVRADLAEVRVTGPEQGYHFEGEAWTGNVDRFVVATRGEGDFDNGAEKGRFKEGEVQALYARALGPWWNLRGGLRQDFGPRGAGMGPQRTHAMLAIDGLSPYRFDIQGALFVSQRGEVTGRIEAAVDERITRRLVLQPRGEVNFSVQDQPDRELGSGLTSIEMGLRLRYEFTRQFAPYVGVLWTSSLGRTADYARAEGKGASSAGLVLGVKVWL